MSTDSQSVFTVKVAVLDDYGLHARPAAILARTAQLFKAESRLICGENSADAKSILDILALAASRNTELILECRGEDAASAGATLLRLFHPDSGAGEDC
jgi:phosphotransferase system HPr (HPr) family protein